MARQTFESWIPEEYQGPVITKMRVTSAVEDLARSVPMATDTKHIPRSGGMEFVGAVAKGTAYTEDGSANDEILLSAKKIGKVLRVADEDLKDTTQVANIIATKQLDWARAYGIGFDNATLGCTGTENATTVPFTSLYKRLTTADSATGYSANANLIQTPASGAGSGSITYANLSALFGLVETGDFWSDGSMAVIAHPAFRAAMRGLVDANGRPLFLENQQGVNGPSDQLWGLPVRWSLGAKTNAVASDRPTGNPLLFVGSTEHLIKGDRSGPEYLLAGADSGPAFLTDEALLKVRVRRAFQVAYPAAWAALELRPAA